MDFTKDEKLSLFSKIEENYFHHNFGTMSKSDFETLLFSVYYKHLKEHSTNLGGYDVYSISLDGCTDMGFPSSFNSSI